MNSITDLWIKNKDIILGKSIQQLITFCADGKLSDGKQSSYEFREFLKNITSEMLSTYAGECLEKKFDDSGLALQDVVNQIGSRIGFFVEDGLYRGRSNAVGFDGIWKTSDNYSLVVEVKTTDAYRINLDTITDYRAKLCDLKKVTKNLSSILIIVGRQDTGDLEAQIRGSRHAWDIRLISIDSLIKLMILRENLDDAKTMQQIAEVLKPQEYTRIDKLIDVIFLTTKDINPVDEFDEADIEDDKQLESKREKKIRVQPSNFHNECISRIEKYLKIPLVKKSRSSFRSSDNSISVVCSVSKIYGKSLSPKYWFAFHPYYEDFLTESSSSFMAYGCGSEDDIVLIPFSELKPLLPDLWTTEKEGKMYYHIVIHRQENKFLLQLPKKNKKVDISDKRI